MKTRLKAFGAILISLLAGGIAHAAVVVIPASALTPSTQYYTDLIGGGIGNIVVMTGGGNAAGVGDPTGRNDDGFSGPINLGFTLPFFGTNYTQFWANNNGNISFNGGISEYIPSGPQGAAQPIISPFFGDVDTRNAASGVSHLRTDVSNEIIATWDQVGYFSHHADKLNSFQLVLRGPDFVVPQGEGRIGFFYKNMEWEVTDTSQVAAAGFGDGQTNGTVIEGSLLPGLNTILSNHHIWFDANLQPVEPGQGTVPVPAPIALIGLGLACMAATRRRRESA
jgi:hypothetical protein